MKILNFSKIILSIALLFCIKSNAFAADISALNFQGDLIGKVIPDGAVINSNNEIIGHLTADGYIFDGNNELIGGVVPQGIAIANNNTILGKVNNDGSVSSINNDIVGKVLPNGLVVNYNYDILGEVISSGLVYNDKGIIVGRISGDGYFYNLQGENKGFITSSGYVYAPEGENNKLSLLGRLMSSKIVTSFNGKFLGSVTPNGKVTDVNKNTIGFIRANGYVVDTDKKAIGHIVERGYGFDFNGNYLGVISYNGEVVNKANVVGYAVNEKRIVDKKGKVIGFSVDFNATANTIDGRILGYIVPNGNIVKGGETVGYIGSTGDVIDGNGKVIGFINHQGPIFDYLGRIRGNSSINGKVIAMDGSDNGYVLKDKAYSYKGNEIGRLLTSKLIYNNANNFMGISGIDALIDYDSQEYIVSPYGYIFNQDGIIEGSSVDFSPIYTPEGNILTYMSAQGNSENTSLNEIAKLQTNGVFIDKNNKILGKAVKNFYATDFEGKSIGYIGKTNLIINDKNQKIAKILPDNSIADLEGKIRHNELAGNSSVNVSINGDYLGTNLYNGALRKDNQDVGYISSDEYVLDTRGALYGKILPFGVAVTPKCEFLGVVSSSGEIRNGKNTYVGMVLPNKQVLNDAEEIIGYVIEPEVVIGDKGEVIGTQSSLGYVLNYQNQKIGCQDIRGNIVNSQNEVIGQKVKYDPIMDFDNKVIGYIDINGIAVDLSGVQLGILDINENIKSKDNINVGSVFKYKVAFDSNNIYLGRVDFSGNVISDDGVNLGKVDYTGEVKTTDGRKGYALYDLYVYDNNEHTVGYIAKNGHVYSIMGEPIGTMYNGFVVDKKQNLIARALRDYNIKDNNKQNIGYLKLDGSVVDTKNILIGSLENDGNIINSENDILGKAFYLQYYKKASIPEVNGYDKENINTKESDYPNQKEDQIDASKVTEEDKEENKEENSSLVDYEEKEGKKEQLDYNNEKTQDLINNNKQNESASSLSSQASGEESSLSPEELKQKKAEEMRLNHKVVGIAITPGGKYIGDIYDNQEVMDENGEIVGRVDDRGNVVDNKGITVGKAENKKRERNTPVNNNWWHKVATGATVSPYSSNDNITNVGPGGGVGPGGRYNPQRAAILAQMHENRRRELKGVSISSGVDAASYTGWQDDWGLARQVSTLRVDMSNVITADKPIPAVLARSLVSLGEAPVTAIVERNIYGDSGRNIIIPAGSRVLGGLQEVGEDSRFDGTSGGVKIEITWNRIIRPDGISFTIGAAATGDAQGRGGGALGYVDEQLVKKYTLPIVGTLVTSAITYMTAVDEEATGQVENSKQQAASDARQNFMDKMDEMLQEIIDRKKEIEPVTYVPAGTRIIIYPMTDLWLRTTKDIDKGVSNLVNDRKITNTLVNPNGYEVEPGARGQQQQVVSTSTANNRKQENQSVNQPLVGPPSNSPQAQQQQQRRVRALPPPSADGSDIVIPDDSSEDDEGEIDLSF